MLLVRRLEREHDTSVRRALILSLGQFTGEQLPIELRRPLVTTLLRWYRDDPDPGVHAAIDWLMRNSHRGDQVRLLDWNQSSALATVDRHLAEANSRAEEQRWYVTWQGVTLVIFSGVLEFRMGSPAFESERMPALDSPDEPLETVRIPRRFAIANKEVTIEQFRQFLDANPEVGKSHAYANNPNRMAQVLHEFSPDDNGPQIAVTWYEAAMYCNWLSKQEGIPETEWVYPPRFEDIRSGMVLPADYLRRTGYRLPTEAEWEYAARAGSTTPRFYGISDSLLSEFAWYSKTPPKSKGDLIDPRDPRRTWPVGQLKPNDFGLFDIYGNVWEWMHDRLQLHPSATSPREDREDSILVVSDSVARARRGGGFPYEAAMMRSAGRGTLTALPSLRRDNVGFRIARSMRSER